MLGKIVAVLLVEVNNRLAVRGRLEPVSPRRQFALQLPVVIDLPVRNHPQRSVFVRERLVSAAEVDDRQPTHAECQRTVGISALVVRATMDRDSPHGLQILRGGA